MFSQINKSLLENLKTAIKNKINYFIYIDKIFFKKNTRGDKTMIVYVDVFPGEYKVSINYCDEHHYLEIIGLDKYDVDTISKWLKRDFKQVKVFKE